MSVKQPKQDYQKVTRVICPKCGQLVKFIFDEFEIGMKRLWHESNSCLVERLK